MKELDRRYDLGERVADNALTRSKDLYNFQKNIELNYGKESYSALNQLKEQQQQQIYNQAIAAGYSPREEFNISVAYSGGKAPSQRSQRNGGNQSNAPKMTAEQTATANTLYNLAEDAKKTLSEDDIGNFENTFNEVGRTLSPQYYQMYRDIIYALKGGQAKKKGDDNTATAWWSQVSDIDLLERTFPNYNFDGYRELQRRGHW